ncbi:MAG: glycerol kinase GlpK, partial [Pseudonocardiaceae bacterium]
MTHYVAAIDQGTTSTRCMVFDHGGQVVSTDQLEHAQYFPAAGWVEHDPREIWANTQQVTVSALAKAGLRAGDIAAVGITNQRETTVVWDRRSGQPVHNAIVWQDTRTARLCAALGAQPGGQNRYQARTGLPLSTYFAGPKIRWILDEVVDARQRAESGELCCGTIDSWLLWNMTGGLHATDVTNASRTLLMDLDTLGWDGGIAGEMGVPVSMLPRICPSSQVYGEIREPAALAGVPIAGILGDQQAALFGQACLSPGEAKNTYGTGNFILLNTGTEQVRSRNGLLTTVAYQIGAQEPVYALEGSIAVTGALVQWLRDNLGMISSAAEIEQLASTVTDNGGAYFVPAFSGLFAPHWRSDARGAIVGLTRYVNRGHLARAVLEATAFQSREVLDAMKSDAADAQLTSLK